MNILRGTVEKLYENFYGEEKEKDYEYFFDKALVFVDDRYTKTLSVAVKGEEAYRFVKKFTELKERTF